MFIQRPLGMGTFEFVIVATQRAGQLMRGCLPRVAGVYKATTMAQVEVAAGKVCRMAPDAVRVPAVTEPPLAVPAAN